ncbi:ubiquitin-conjugating enzyme E2 T-like [Lineus longissimus]|uniref:ubiquitin-conjugating enzyme E2 T-like n=1 Tax=Lineus longissimus TaxID=88925 RepID=UPI002B4EE4E2
MQKPALVARMKREVQIFQQSPPHGISCWTKGNHLTELEANIIGGEGTPYEGGIFKLEVNISDRYPFEPPKVKFVTPIYHPNIDNGGRICLDSLKMPPKGAWKPSLNISTILTQIQQLMAEPNPDDPLMADISNEFCYNKPLFLKTAAEWTKKHASQKDDKENETKPSPKETPIDTSIVSEGKRSFGCSSQESTAGKKMRT